MTFIYKPKGVLMPSINKKTMPIILFTFFLVFSSFGISYAITWTPSFSSSSHTVGGTSTNTTVTVSWSAMTPTGGSSEDAYIFVWDNTDNTTLSADKSRTETYGGFVNHPTVSLTRTLTSNTWYLHMRAVDSGVNWTDTVHLGPITIDSTPAPTVSAITPSSGKNNSTTVSVTITGTNYKKTDGSDFDSVSATIGGTALTNVTIDNSTTISATYAIQNKTAGQYDISVTTDYGSCEAPLSNGFTVSNPAPTVTSVSPGSGANDSSKNITITGTGFLSTGTLPAGTDSPTVQLRDTDNSLTVDCTSITVNSTTSISASVPLGKTASTYDIVVTNSDSQSGTGTDLYEITAPAPTISSVSPASASNSQATTITVTGTNFQTSGTTIVALEASGEDTISCSSVSVDNSTKLTASVPSEQETGTYDVKVTNPDSQSATSSSAFTISNPVATVSSITPSSMTNDDTQSVTIVGTNFRTGLSVKIGTTSCTTVILDSENPTTQLTCYVPADIDPDDYDVVVTNIGANPGTLSAGFTVNAGTTTVALTYSASDTSHVPAGSLTITATFTTSQSAAPLISIDQQGSTDIEDASLTATTDEKIWTYSYIVNDDDNSTYIDGAASVTIKDSNELSINTTSGSSFTIDSQSLSAVITYEQGDNTAGPFKVGDLTITVTLSDNDTSAPLISIDQTGTSDISDEVMDGDNRTWTYDYTITEDNDAEYDDGTATVSLTDDNSSTIIIGNGETFTIDTAAPTVALSYNQDSDTEGPFSSGSLIITALFSEAPDDTPQIAIDQPGTTDLSATDMSGTSTVWTYTYTINTTNESEYADGVATITISNGADSAGNANEAATNSTFTIDTAAVDSCFITTAEGQ